MKRIFAFLTLFSLCTMFTFSATASTVVFPCDKNGNGLESKPISIDTLNNEFRGETMVEEFKIIVKIVIEQDHTLAVIKPIDGVFPEPPANMWYELSICDEKNNWFDLTGIDYSDLPLIKYEFEGRLEKPVHIYCYLEEYSDEGCQKIYLFSPCSNTNSQQEL